MDEYAIVIDESYDAILLRDVCEREALKYAERAAAAVNSASRQRNLQKQAVFAKYVERFDYIRLQAVQHMRAGLGLSDA
jgi:hypothetical protein